MVALARITDPETSHEAAASVTDTSMLQDRIVFLLGVSDYHDGSVTDEELISLYDSFFASTNPATPQSIRSRRAELVSKGYVVFDGEYGMTVNGRRTRKWRLADRSTV